MRRIVQIGLVLLAVSLSLTANSQTVYEVKSHNLVVKGTSNLHDWDAEVENLKGTFKLNVENGKIVDLQYLKIVVDAKSLISSKGSIMNSKINDALNSKKYPEIIYVLQSVNSISEKNGLYSLNTTGLLTISGVTKKVTLDATGKVNSNGDVEFSGAKNVKMTDYKVEPPTAMFGALTTGDDVSINFKVTLRSSQLTNTK